MSTSATTRAPSLSGSGGHGEKGKMVEGDRLPLLSDRGIRPHSILFSALLPASDRGTVPVAPSWDVFLVLDGQCAVGRAGTPLCSLPCDSGPS